MTASTSTFTGFDPEAVRLLVALPTFDAEQYAAERKRLTAGLTQPGAALVAEIAAQLDADLTVVPRRSVSPLHRDRRFAPPDAPRYKDHLLLTTWEGADKRSSPTLWLRIDAVCAGFASGVGFTPAIRDRWRDAIADDRGAALSDVLERLIDDGDAEVAGDEVRRVPRPCDDTHPRADLLRKIGFQVRFTDDLPATVDDPSFVGWCVERLERLLPVHRWLVDEMLGSG